MAADFLSACIFSEVNGVLYSNGIPLKNTRVIRSYEYGSLKHEEVITDNLGRFHFPEVRQISVGLLPMEFVVAQSIVVVHEGKKINIWSNTKRSKAQNSELGGVQLNLKCEISDKLKIYRDFGSILRTRCTW